jgi:hypothetical protein
MRYSPLSILSLLAVSFCINSCKNDLKLNAPYKEIPSVYAVLCAQEKIQMIRVNKVFLGQGDANAMAQVADSVNYQPGDLTITLERFVSDVQGLATTTGNKNVITFHDSVVQTGTGAFARTQRVYVTGDKLFTFGEYRLKIYNNHTKNTFTAKASVIDSVPPSVGPLTKGHYYGDPTNLSLIGDPTIWIDYSKPGTSYAVRFAPTPSLATIFQLTVRFHYIDSLVTGDTAQAYVDFNFSKLTSNDISYVGGAGPFVTYNFKGSDVYDDVASSLSKSSRSTSSIEGRRMFKISYIVYSATQEYNDYLQYSEPSLSIAQEKPLYSNFDNNAAIGIFTFRARHFIQRQMASQFIDEFANNSTTCPYKFYIVSNGPPHLNPLCQ